MDLLDRITVEPGKRGGKPCIRGMRITVYDVLGWLAAGITEKEILEDYPELEPDDLRACLAYAAEREQRVLRGPRPREAPARSESLLPFRARTPAALPGSTHVRLIGLATAGDLGIWRFARQQGFVRSVTHASETPALFAAALATSV